MLEDVDISPLLESDILKVKLQEPRTEEDSPIPGLAKGEKEQVMHIIYRALRHHDGRSVLNLKELSILASIATTRPRNRTELKSALAFYDIHPEENARYSPVHKKNRKGYYVEWKATPEQIEEWLFDFGEPDDILNAAASEQSTTERALQHQLTG